MLDLSMKENPTEAEAATDLPVLYALIWRAEGDGPDADEAFQQRIPRLMEWLRDLKGKGHLVACGGGSFEREAGGLTLIQAPSVENAQALSEGSPLNEIGSTEVFLWDVFHADLQANVDWPG